MTEAEIETAAARKMDRLDRVYLTSAMTEAQYKAAIAEIDRWAATQRRGER